MHLKEVVHDTVEKPLDVHLPFASQGESIEAKSRTDITEHWLNGSEPSAVDKATFHGIDLLFHPFGKALRSFLKEVDLSCLGTVRVSQALLTEVAGATVGLVAPELDSRSASDRHLAAVAVEAFACRADTEGLVRAERELIDGEGRGGTVIGCMFFFKAFLVPISLGEARISLSELGICHIGIDILAREHLEVLLRVEAGICGQCGALKHVRIADGGEVLLYAF